jgi:hypothetical protein
MVETGMLVLAGTLDSAGIVVSGTTVVGATVVGRTVVGRTLVGTPVVCGWQTSLVQVTVWVTVMLVVPVVTEVTVLEPEVIVVVPTGQVVVTKVIVLVVTGVVAGPEGAMVVGPTELGTRVPGLVTTGTVATEEDPLATPVREPVVHVVVLGW